MKNIIVFYITFLLLSLFSACTKKDKPVIYPTTGGPVNPVTSGTLGVGADSKTISDFSKSGNVMSFKTTTHAVEITFNNSNFADQTYLTKASVTADNEVTIKVTDLGNGEVYLVNDDAELTIQTASANGITANAVMFAFGEAKPTADPTRSSITISFGVTSTK